MDNNTNEAEQTEKSRIVSPDDVNLDINNSEQNEAGQNENKQTSPGDVNLDIDEQEPQTQSTSTDFNKQDTNLPNNFTNTENEEGQPKNPEEGQPPEQKEQKKSEPFALPCSLYFRLMGGLLGGLDSMKEATDNLFDLIAIKLKERNINEEDIKDNREFEKMVQDIIKNDAELSKNIADLENKCKDKNGNVDENKLQETVKKQMKENGLEHLIPPEGKEKITRKDVEEMVQKAKLENLQEANATAKENTGENLEGTQQENPKLKTQNILEPKNTQNILEPEEKTKITVSDANDLTTVPPQAPQQQTGTGMGI